MDTPMRTMTSKEENSLSFGNPETKNSTRKPGDFSNWKERMAEQDKILAAEAERLGRELTMYDEEEIIMAGFETYEEYKEWMKAEDAREKQQR